MSKLIKFSTKKELLDDYALSVQRIVDAFMYKWLNKEEFEVYDYYEDVHWIGDNVGEVFSFGDYFITFSDIVTDIRKDAPKGCFEEWYWATVEGDHESKINYASWCMGLRYEHLKNNELCRSEKE